MAKDKDHKRTGIDLIDNLTPQERRDLKAKLQQHFDSLSHQEKIEHMNLMHDLIREKMRQHGGMISKEDAIKEYLNEDFPEIVEQTASDVERTAAETGDIGYMHIANNIRKTRWGVDAFDIKVNLVNDDQPVGVYYEEKAKAE